MKSRDVERELYLAQRRLGDLRALKNGKLPVRLVKRVYHRKAIGLLKRAGLW